mmetsp:Transcript_93984/g.265400  ORF Transcript_93984/g.265400 Transcript_93984/m.265400 type:complete len:110 (+) Transcript_93984:64-393(+)
MRTLIKRDVKRARAAGAKGWHNQPAEAKAPPTMALVQARLLACLPQGLPGPPCDVLSLDSAWNSSGTIVKGLQTGTGVSDFVQNTKRDMCKKSRGHQLRSRSNTAESLT